jgi:hypothetical protein
MEDSIEIPSATMPAGIEDQAFGINDGRRPSTGQPSAQGGGGFEGLFPTTPSAKASATPTQVTQLALFPDGPDGNLRRVNLAAEAPSHSFSGRSALVKVEDNGCG